MGLDNPLRSSKLIQGDVLDVLPTLGHFACSFLDPPDALGLKLNGYVERSRKGYIEWLAQVVQETIAHCGITWLSYNSRWDLAVKHWAHDFSQINTDIEIKPFAWTFTFGQNCNTDCGPGHRPILRFRHAGAPIYPEQVKVPSWRMIHGDKRAAAGGRVPLDHWNFPRVVGNAKERRPWHPTQHPEALLERAILLSTKEGDGVLDLFSGTGTVIRVCKRINRSTTSVELNPTYCTEISKEHGLDIEVIGDTSYEHR
jgi:site-specific DNA-methyltransferase (adenine-specific)